MFEGSVFMRKSFVIGALSASVLLAGCQAVNTTSGGAVGVERKQYMFSMLSTDEVNQMYAQSYQQTLGEASSKGVLDKTSNNAKRVQLIADRLIAQAPQFRPDSAQWNWEVNLIKSDELNANCGPGGKIFVYSGLIEKLKLTDDELAAVMGHEIAHALREHGREAMSKAYGVQMARQGAGALLGLGQDSMAIADTVVAVQHDPAQQPRQRERSRPDRPGAGRPRRLQPECGDQLVGQDGPGLGWLAAGVHEHSPGVGQPSGFVAGGDSEGDAVVRAGPQVKIAGHARSHRPL